MLVLRAPETAFIRYVAMFSFLAALYFFTIAVFDLPNALVLILARSSSRGFSLQQCASARSGNSQALFSRGVHDLVFGSSFHSRFFFLGPSSLPILSWAVPSRRMS